MDLPLGLHSKRTERKEKCCDSKVFVWAKSIILGDRFNEEMFTYGYKRCHLGHIVFVKSKNIIVVMLIVSMIV